LVLFMENPDLWKKFFSSNLAMIACYGEALVDLIVSPYSHGELCSNSEACLGGSVFNFCLAAQRQGLQALYLNALSTDVFGRQFAKVLEAEGVQLDAEPCSEPTSVAVVQLDDQGKASYAFHRIGVADTARSAPEIIAKWHPKVQALHTGCLMLTPGAWQATQQVIAHAAASRCVISVDANMRPSVCPDVQAYRPLVLQACAMAQIVKVSDDDLVALGWLAGDDARDMQACVDAAQRFFQQSEQTELVALTLGASGAWLLSRDQQCYQAAPQGINVADTVGAGDNFAAALLAHLDRQCLLKRGAMRQAATPALQSALVHACSAAAISVQRVGSDPANWEETVAAISLLYKK
jgi:fructokinase